MKPYTPTYEQQADTLVNAGMRSSAGLSGELLRREIAECLEFINFHRLEPYWKYNINTRQGTQLCFYPGTCWEDIMVRYMFDRHLRSVIFDASARIEVALRTRIAHLWTEETGSNFPQRSSNNYNSFFNVGDFLSTVDMYYQGSQAEDAVRYRAQYADARVLPIGLFVEFTSFGNLRKLLFQGLKNSSGITAKIAADMGMANDIKFFLSGIALLNDIRNSCAHQARIWNRRWLSRNHKNILRKGTDFLWDYKWDSVTGEWSPTGNGEKLVRGQETTAAALTFIYRMMKVIAPHSHWRERLVKLLTSTDGVPKHAYKGVGFTNPYWMKHPLWTAEPQSCHHAPMPTTPASPPF